MNASRQRAAAHPSPRLQAAGWAPAARTALQHLIHTHRGQHLAAVFDFDNTLVCGDIGEATLAVLVRDGTLKRAEVPPTLSPSFRPAGRRRVTLADGPDPTVYYEAFLAPTDHGAADPTPLANGYAWAVEVMEGLRVADILRATETAFSCSTLGRLNPIEVSPGQTAFPAPFFYPESVELVATLLRHGFDVWIASASNVWSVRWMVQYGLNPLLRHYGVRRGIAPERILGVSTLLRDSRDRLFKDARLVVDDPAYAQLDASRLSRLRLTSRLQFPVPTYSGKVAALWDALGCHPFLAVGDSPGDHAMLSFSKHRLWIARLDKPAYQEQTRRLCRAASPAHWIIQPVLTGSHPGFVADPRSLLTASDTGPSVRRSLRLWAASL